MSGCILCKIPRAREPYYMDCISTNLYSMEELCYVLDKNIYLIDQDVINEDLIFWLRDQLGRTLLAQRLLSLKEKQNASLWEMLSLLFQEINYFSHAERRTFENKIKALEREDFLHRNKKKADTLAENGMYVKAIEIYLSLLASPQLQEQTGLLGSVYHNMGCVYSYLFQKEEALRYFEKAYQLLHTGEAIKSYLYAFYMAKTPIEYASKLSELGVDEATAREVKEEIEKVENADRPVIPTQQVDEILSDMMKGYHRSVGA